MPSTTSTVGGLTLPIPAGVQNAALADPVVNGLLDYLGWCLRNDLNTKLANMQGMGSDACPVANRFPWNPASYFARKSIPALYGWWDGKSRHSSRTMLYEQRERTINVTWIWEEMTGPHGLTARAGLLPAVDACFAKAAERDRHPSYSYASGAATSPGASVSRSLSLAGWAYLGGEVGNLQSVPNVSPQAGGPGEGNVVRFYPALQAQFVIIEQVDPPTLEDPGDVLRDMTLGIETNENGDMTDTVPFMDRVLVGPDGSEPDPEAR